MHRRLIWAVAVLSAFASVWFGFRGVAVAVWESAMWTHWQALSQADAVNLDRVRLVMPGMGLPYTYRPIRAGTTVTPFHELFGGLVHRARSLGLAGACVLAANSLVLAAIAWTLPRPTGSRGEVQPAVESGRV